MKYKYLLFDLDGTICDTCEGVQRCFNYALSKFGKEVKDYKTLTGIIGPPLVDSFIARGFTHSDALVALSHYRKRYTKHGMLEENRLFDGMDILLKDCKNAGYIISTATSKPEKFAKIILKYFNVAKYFDLIAGASFDSSRSTKEKVLEYTLDTLKVKNKDEVLLIGDTKFDLMGAEYIGIDAVGVRYGYSAPGELEMYKNVGIFNTVSELKDFLLN